MDTINIITRILVIIGAVNWGLYAISPSIELVQYLQINWLIIIVYGLVGLAGIWELIMLFKSFNQE